MGLEASHPQPFPSWHLPRVRAAREEVSRRLFGSRAAAEASFASGFGGSSMRRTSTSTSVPASSGKAWIRCCGPAAGAMRRDHNQNQNQSRADAESESESEWPAQKS